MNLDELNTDTLLALAAILGAVVAPIMSAYGLYLQHRRDKPKTDAETKKLELEARELDNRVDIAVMASYSSIVSDLRNQVDSLIELSKRNSGEIALLKAQLETVSIDKIKLERDNAELLREVISLREEVEILRKQLKENNNGTSLKSTKIT